MAENWWEWRLLQTSKLNQVSMRDLIEVWSFEDTVQAHELLDALEDAEARARSLARST